MMNVLIITSIWTGAQPFFLHGKIGSTGMPAFNNVFLRLIDDERINNIHILVWLEDATTVVNIPEAYKSKITIHPFCITKKSLLRSAAVIWKIIAHGCRLIKTDRINRIIGFGSVAALGAIIGYRTGVADFRRIYGTFLINEIEESKLRLFKRHPLEFLCFSMRGRGLLVTNDGTKGDIVFKKIGNPKLPFHFPLNGVSKQIAESSVKPDLQMEQKFLSYIARLDSWKRQNLLIEALGILKRRDVQIPKTYIVGSAHEKDYVVNLLKLIENNNLSNDVEVVYGLPINEVHYILKHSLITFSLYHTSNLGNVFIESLQLGTPVIAINDTGSLDLIDNKAFVELKSDETNVIANAIESLLADDARRRDLSSNAIAFANSHIKSWNDRAKYEIDLMLD